MKYRNSSGFQGQDCLIMPFPVPGVLLVSCPLDKLLFLTPLGVQMPPPPWSPLWLTPTLDPDAPSSGIPEQIIHTSITPIICYKKYPLMCLVLPALRLNAPRGRGRIFFFFFFLVPRCIALGGHKVLSNKGMRGWILHMVALEEETLKEGPRGQTLNERLLSIYCEWKGMLNAKNTVQLKTDLVSALT